VSRFQSLRPVRRVAKLESLGRFHAMNIARISLLLTAFVCLLGCQTPLGKNPLEGWKGKGNAFLVHGCPFPESICADYRAYLETLPSWQRFHSKDGMNIDFFEDAAGQRAVTIRIPDNGIHWVHVLIYDQSGKRTKFIKYAEGRYAC